MDLSAFTLTTGECTSITYELALTNGDTIDTTVFTFSESDLTLTVGTFSASKIGTYEFTLTGYLSGDD
jgi:hypothetical protein